MGRLAGSWKAEMNSLNAQTTFQLFLPSTNLALKTHSCGMFFFLPILTKEGGFLTSCGLLEDKRTW